MQRKIIGILICMLLLATIIPTISATQPLPNEIKKFKNCYFVADGLLTDRDFPSIIGISMWKIFYVPSGDGRAYVLYWFLRFNETANVTIYSEQNGEILWQHQGMTVPQLRILSFSGLYTASDDGLHISGKIGFVQIIEK
jgi:hypothetical protein